MEILKGDPYCSMCYAIKAKKGILLIDTGDGSINFDFKPALVILTHNHKDHTLGCKKNWNIYLHELDFKNNNEYSYVPENANIIDFKNIEWGEWNFKILHTPGHTPGSICLYDVNKKTLFSGDTLFHNGVGRTDLGGNPKQLENSLALLRKLKINNLFPGHDI